MVQDKSDRTNLLTGNGKDFRAVPFEYLPLYPCHSFWQSFVSSKLEILVKRNDPVIQEITE